MECAWVAAAGSALFAWVVGVSARGGVLGAARNDDWGYYRIVFRFASTGRFQLDHWTQAMFVGQAIVAWPLVRVLGPHIAVLQVFVAALGCVGVALAYVCVRRLLSVRMALVAVVPLALGPSFGALAVSFMTDVPAMTLQVIAIYMAVRALESTLRSTSWWVAALVAGVGAFSVREYAAATFAAVAVAAVATSPSAAQRIVRLVAVACSATSMVVLYVWRHELAGNVDTRVHVGFAQLQHAQSYLFTLSLLVLPACWVVSGRRLGRLLLRRRQSRTIIGLAVLLVGLAIGHQAVLGNYVTPAGISSPAPVRPLLGTGAWRVVLLLGVTAEATVVGLAVLAVATSRSRPERRGRTSTDEVRRLFSSMVIIGVAGQLLLMLFSDAPAWDRYLLPFLPFASCLIIDTARRWDLVAAGRSWLLPATAVVAVALVGGEYVDRAAQYDGAAWTLGNRAVAAGYDPTTVEAGYAWIGYHQPGVDAWPGAPDPGFWRHPTRKRCVVLSFRPRGQTVPEHTLAVVTTASPPWDPLELIATLGPDHCSTANPRGR